MQARLQTLGYALAIIGLLFVAGGAVAYAQVQNGYDSLQAFSAAQDVQLTYNEDGQLVDRGTVEGAEAIMTLLTDEWGYNAQAGDFDPADPLVNTDSEYMFQMATIVHHTTTGTTTVTVPQDTEFNGEIIAAGDYEVELGGRYWSEFDRTSPLDGPAREAAWSGTVHGLVGELGVGTVTHSALQMGLGIAAILGGLGGTLLLAGAGLVWASRADDEYSTILIPETARASAAV